MTKLTALTLEDMAHWPLRMQVLVLLLLILIIQAAGYVYYLTPKQRVLQQLRQQETARRASMQINTRHAATLAERQAEFDALSARYALLLRQLPAQNELASLLAAVNQTGLDHRLGLTRIDWGERQPQDFLYRLPLNIEVTGQYADVGDFAQAIARLPRLIDFDQADWQRVSPDSNVLRVRIRAFAYQQKEEDRDDAQH